MSKNPVMVAVARHAGACQTGDPVRIAKAKQAITEAKLRRAIHEALGATPPLDPETLESLAALLTGRAK